MPDPIVAVGGRGRGRLTNVMRLVCFAGMIGLATLIPHSSVWSAAPQKALTVVSWGGNYTRSQMLAYVKPFRKHRSQWVAMETYGGGLDELREQVETENVVWDVVDFELSDLIRGCQEGLLEKIDHGTLTPGVDGTPPAQDFMEGALTECGVGQTVWSTVVAFDSEAMGDNPPTQIADFFDVKKFPGKRGLRRDPRIVMEWALIADGVPLDEVYATLGTEEGRKRAFSVLDRIKSSIVWWSDGEKPVELLGSGDVVMTSVWSGRMFRPIIEDGKSFSILWDGQVWDIDSWGIPKGTYNKGRAMDFIRFATGSQRLADQAKYIAYGPTRFSAMPLVEEAVRPLLPTSDENMANALQTDAVWWAANHEELSAEFESWFAAGGRGLAGTAR